MIIDTGSVKILNLYNTNIRLTGLGLGSYLPQIPPTNLEFRIYNPYKNLSNLIRNSARIKEIGRFIIKENLIYFINIINR